MKRGSQEMATIWILGGAVQWGTVGGQVAGGVEGAGGVVRCRQSSTVDVEAQEELTGWVSRLKRWILLDPVEEEGGREGSDCWCGWWRVEDGVEGSRLEDGNRGDGGPDRPAALDGEEDGWRGGKREKAGDRGGGVVLHRRRVVLVDGKQGGGWTA